MDSFIRVFGAALITGVAIFYIPDSQADSAPLASQFYPYVGTWHGHGLLTAPGQKPVKLKLTVSCHKVAAGWAVGCAVHAWNKQMAMHEADLMAVDTATGKAHWFGVNNQGEAYDYRVTWPNAHTMHAYYAWMQDDKPMQENVVFTFKDKRHLSWSSIDTIEGHQQVGSFTGDVMRK